MAILKSTEYGRRTFGWGTPIPSNEEFCNNEDDALVELKAPVSSSGSVESSKRNKLSSLIMEGSADDMIIPVV